MKAFTPTGLAIVGTLETVPGTATITPGTFGKDADGKLTFDYGGGTTIHWDDQKTVTRQGSRIFLDEDGDEWTEDQLVLREDDDEDEVEGEE